MNQRRSIRWVFDCNKWYPTRQEWMKASTSVNNEEKVRIGKFYYKRDAKNCMAGRLLMRKFLTLESRLKWREIQISQGKHGKPIFCRPEGPPLNFNISHHGSYAILAGEVGDIKVGVDIMTVNYKSGDELKDYLNLMKRQFSSNEWEIIKNPKYSDHDICRMFFRIWCLKESYLKAIGTGLSENLKEISFNIKEEEVKEDGFLLSTELTVQGQSLKDWSFQEILIDKDTYAAVALSPKVDPVVNKFQNLSFDELIAEAEEISPDDEQYCNNFFEKLSFPSIPMYDDKV